MERNIYWESLIMRRRLMAKEQSLVKVNSKRTVIKDGSDIWASFYKVKYHNRPVLTTYQVSRLFGYTYETGVRNVVLRNKGFFEEDYDYFTVSDQQSIESLITLQSQNSECVVQNKFLQNSECVVRSLVNFFDENKDFSKLRKVTLWTENGIRKLTHKINNPISDELFLIFMNKYFNKSALPGWRKNVPLSLEQISLQTHKQFEEVSPRYHTNPALGTTALYKGVFGKFTPKAMMEREEIEQLQRAEKLVVRKADDFDIEYPEEGQMVITTMGILVRATEEGDFEKIINSAKILKRAELTDEQKMNLAHEYRIDTKTFFDLVS